MINVLDIDEDEFKFDYEKYTNLAFRRRGAIINETIMLERIIDDYISAHFCDTAEKRLELLENLMATNRIIFENKVQIFKSILEKHNPQFLEKHPSLFNNILKTVIPERNVFAHYWLVTSKELSEWIKESKTVFVKFKNKTEHIEYTPEKYTSISKCIAGCIRACLELDAN